MHESYPLSLESEPPSYPINSRQRLNPHSPLKSFTPLSSSSLKTGRNRDRGGRVKEPTGSRV